MNNRRRRGAKARAKQRKELRRLREFYIRPAMVSLVDRETGLMVRFMREWRWSILREPRYAGAVVTSGS